MSKEFKVGLLALTSGLILYFGFNYLKGIDFFSPTQKYYAIYDNVQGLQVSNPVYVNGFTVGRVSNITIEQTMDNLLVVELDVDKNLIVGDSATALLFNSDFLGSKAIELKIGNIRKPVESGDTLISNIDRGITEVLEKTGVQVDNLGVTIRRINEILLGLEGSGEEIKGTIMEIRIVLAKARGLIDKNDEKISDVITSIGGTIDNLNRTIDDVRPIFAKTGTTLDKVNSLELEATLDSLQQSLAGFNQLLSGLNAGEGSAGKILKDDTLYMNMNQALVSLDTLLKHINQYPKHFFGPLGKKAKKVQRDLEKAER